MKKYVYHYYAAAEMKDMDGIITADNALTCDTNYDEAKKLIKEYFGLSVNSQSIIIKSLSFLHEVEDV